jgi:hypothetical protein
MDDDGIDSLVRAVAASPPVTPRADRVHAILLRPSGERDSLARVRLLARPFDAAVGSGPAGALTVTFVGDDHVAEAASCALALRSAFARGHLALATGKMEPVGPALSDAILARAAALLDRDRDTTAVPIDDATADLLDPSFDVRGAPSERTLVGRRPVGRTWSRRARSTSRGGGCASRTRQPRPRIANGTVRTRSRSRE